MQNDLRDLIDDLMYRTPKFAMEFLLETPWDESGDEALPEFQKVTDPEQGATEVLQNLTERMRWWT
ncbi:MAG: hypothetical protein OXI63_18545 [Candidatus Poribacteria bacterium]|nr:hypothetical protein [Candidatus Poribacteria bacterium]